MKRKYDSCFQSNDFFGADCLALCSKKLGEYEFPIPIFSQIKRSLAVLFQRFSKTTIDIYYKKVKRQDFSDEDSDKPIPFYDKLEQHSLSSGGIVLKFERKGFNIFKDSLSKRHLMNMNIKIVTSLLTILSLAFTS